MEKKTRKTRSVNITKREQINVLSKATCLAPEIIECILKVYWNCMREAFINGIGFDLPYVGRINAKRTEPRDWKMPYTNKYHKKGEIVRIPGRYQPFFVPNTDVRRIIKKNTAFDYDENGKEVPYIGGVPDED